MSADYQVLAPGKLAVAASTTTYADMLWLYNTLTRAQKSTVVAECFSTIGSTSSLKRRLTSNPTRCILVDEEKKLIQHLFNGNTNAYRTYMLSAPNANEKVVTTSLNTIMLDLDQYLASLTDPTEIKLFKEQLQARLVIAQAKENMAIAQNKEG